MLSGPRILSSIIKNFLHKSKCATEKQQKKYLLSLLGNKRLVTKLLYCGTEDGFRPEYFHDLCDHKGPTICLFKIRHGEKEGDCIGGYTKA